MELVEAVVSLVLVANLEARTVVASSSASFSESAWSEAVPAKRRLPVVVSTLRESADFLFIICWLMHGSD